MEKHILFDMHVLQFIAEKGESMLEINEKLQHLTEEQIEEILELYQNKEVKITDIIDKYEIDVRPAGFRKILPPVKSDVECIICGEKMYYQIGTRDSCEKPTRYFCLKCNHKKCTDYWGAEEVCNCEGCVNLRLQKENEQRKQIETIYACEEDKVLFEELQLNDQVLLIKLLLENPLHNTSYIAPFSGSDKFITTLNRLLDINVLSVSSKSEISAFQKENFPYRYDVTAVSYNVNVIFNDDDISKINRRQYFIDNSSPEELLSLYQAYIYNDIIDKFRVMMGERELTLKITKDADAEFKQLINSVSYTKLLTLCLRVARYLSDKVLVGDMPRYIANNIALGNVVKFYKRAVELEWKLNESEFEQAGDDLVFFIEIIMGKSISILQDVPSIENLNVWPDKERNYNIRVREK